VSGFKILVEKGFPLMAQSMGMSTGMEQTLNPKMIAFYELLQQPGVELEQAIESELQDNPALEVTAPT
jgi:DNA-directed RNA polymerase specialized sigma54-like protein